jgi:hypothetical protein
MDARWYPTAWSTSCWGQLLVLLLTYITVLWGWKRELHENASKDKETSRHSYLGIRFAVASSLFLLSASLAVQSDISKRIDSAKQARQRQSLQQQLVDSLTNDGLESLANSTALRMSASYQAFETADIHLQNRLSTSNDAEERKSIVRDRDQLQQRFLSENMPLLEIANAVRVAMLVRIGPLTEEQKNAAFKSPYDFRTDTGKLYELVNRLPKTASPAQSPQ